MKSLFRAFSWLIVSSALLAALSGGCARSAAAPGNPMTLPVGDRDAVREEVVEVLDAMHFDVERPPRSPERVDTRPLVSAYALEFWRPDVRTRRDRIETALHTVRRRVTVFLRSVDSTGGKTKETTAVEVVARKERLYVEKPVDAKTVSDAYSVFRKGQGALHRFETEWGQRGQWADMGRDAELEHYLLSRIRQRF